jgi:hypothetical protein
MEAYRAVTKSGLIARRAAQVYAIHFERGALTKREMFRAYQEDHPRSKVQVDSFGPRYSQLVGAGLLIEVGERQCKVSLRISTIWDVTGKVPTQALGSRRQKSLPTEDEGHPRVEQLEKLLAAAYERIKELEDRGAQVPAAGIGEQGRMF